MAGTTTKPAAKSKASTPATKPAAKGKATAKGKPATATAATGTKKGTPLMGGLDKKPAATAKAKGRGT